MSYTYTNGFKYTFKTITTHDFVKIIDKLHELFGEGYKFEPEDKAEAAIVFVEWPGKNENEYKSFRFHSSMEGDFKQDCYEVWKNAPLEIKWINENKSKTPSYTSWLKAFYKAPCWTPQEVEHFKTALRSVGIVCAKGKLTKLDCSLYKKSYLGLEYGSPMKPMS